MRQFEVPPDKESKNMAQDLGTTPITEDVPIRTLWVEKYEPEGMAPEGAIIFVDDFVFNLGWFVRLVRKWLPNVAAYGTLFQFDPVLVYNHQPFDVLIADVILPKQRATIWLRPYKEFLLDHGIATVFTSSLPEKDFWTVASVDGWQKEELCYYIEKPWDRDRFVEIIKHCLEYRDDRKTSLGRGRPARSAGGSS